MWFKLSFVLILTIGFSLSLASNHYKLEQVLILSRHGVRTPLALNMGELTPRTWPRWRQKPGNLTPKGAQLEGYMGEYFYQWFDKQKLLPSPCPNEDIFYIYSNTKQRARASAQAFVKKAFPNCNVTVHHKNTEESDPIFTPYVRNNTIAFRDIALQEMQAKLSKLSLNGYFIDLESILDFKQSKMCKEADLCMLTGPSKVKPVVAGQKPVVSGPLKISHSVIDAFLMEYYEGFPLKDVAWGHIKDTNEWHRLLSIFNGYHSVIFNTTYIARDIAKPLLHYIRDIFINESPKIMFLMGHDANLLTVINSMRFKAFQLPNQYELTPVGSKIVIQKWYDQTRKLYLGKTEFVYQSTEQLRDGEELSLTSPPQSIVLELSECTVDSQGFCLWDDFIKHLDDVVNSFQLW